jgi:ribonucleoside-triphosphate reductase
MSKLGYLSHSEEDLFERTRALSIIAKKSLELKRAALKVWYDAGLYPYTKRYLTSGYDNHFSTIGVVGMNEMCRNFFRNTKKKDLDISTREGVALTVKMLNHLRSLASEFQVETGNLYNIESTPAESTCYRLAKHDRLKYPDIITAGTQATPYYTNSSNLPVGYTDDPWVAIKHQEQIQQLYTGGTVLHTYMSESVEDWRKVRDFVKKVMYNTKLPYLTMTPTFSVCMIHGFIKGDAHGVCPHCKEEAVHAYEAKLEELKKKREEYCSSDSCCD